MTEAGGDKSVIEAEQYKRVIPLGEMTTEQRLILFHSANFYIETQRSRNPIHSFTDPYKCVGAFLGQLIVTGKTIEGVIIVTPVFH